MHAHIFIGIEQAVCNGRDQHAKDINVWGNYCFICPTWYLVLYKREWQLGSINLP